MMETEIGQDFVDVSNVSQSTTNGVTKKDKSRKAKMQRRARALEKIAKGEKRGPSQPKNKATKDGSGGSWSDSFWQLVGSEEESKKRKKDSESGGSIGDEDEENIGTDRTWALVSWNEMRADAAKRLIEAEGPNPTLPNTEIERLEEGAQEKWEIFYQRNRDRFFKSRRYLQLEFPELLPPNPTPDMTQRKFPPPVVARFGASAPTNVFLPTQTTGTTTSCSSSSLSSLSSSPYPLAPSSTTGGSDEMSSSTPGVEVERRNILEVGCGVGNTLFPILEINPHNFYYAFDFSASAIEIVKSNPLYVESQRCKAFVFDLTSPSLPSQEQEPGFPAEGSIDIVLMIFVLSAVSPEKMKTALNNINKVLKPGGIILFRDYGLYDMTQMRFVSKGGRKLGENFYTRGDGTRTYFFSKEVAESLFSSTGFETLSLEYDTRELRNRKRMISMYRVWLVAKFQKPTTTTTTTSSSSSTASTIS